MKITKNSLKFVLGFLVSLLLLSFTVPSVLAADFREGDNLVIAADEVIDDDLFIAGQTVEINGTVNGDVLASAQTVTINGVINGALITSGAEVIINGAVNGNLFAGAAKIIVGPQAQVSESVFIGGAAIEVQEGATLQRNLFVGGYQLQMLGKIERSLYAGTAATEFAGEVGRDVYLSVGAPEPGDSTAQILRSVFANNPTMPSIDFINPGLTVKEGAKVSGEFNYSSTQEQLPSTFKPEKGVNFTLETEEAAETLTPEQIAAQVAEQARKAFFSAVRNAVGEFVALVLVGAFLLWKLPTLLNRWSQSIQSQMSKTVLWGLGTLFGFPIFAFVTVVLLILLAIVFGILTAGNLNVVGIGFSALGFLATVTGFVIWTVSKVIVAYWVGLLILKQLRPSVFDGKWGNYLAMALGALLYILVSSIPVVGWVLVLVVIVLGTGAVAYWLRQITTPQTVAQIAPQAA
ncbi:MAG TPA: polymer-forming cytoskeletal protein [Anaerolineales bacterium]|nr:polymer-forming cytoskeletal protein [Anaerolineales bacterium]